MSQELGTPVYWEGDGAAYASTKSDYGYTELEHASAPLWFSDKKAQEQHFHDTYVHMNTLHEKNLQTSSYAKLLSWLQENNKEYFCITSNVDSAFLHAGYDSFNLFEIHGSYRKSQCLMFPEHGLFRTNPELENTPCPKCKSSSRPNVLFFNDGWFNSDNHLIQEIRLRKFLREQGTTVLLEVGVGTTVMNLRNLTNSLYMEQRFPLIHVNPADPEELISEQTYMATPEYWIQETAANGLNQLLQ